MIEFSETPVSYDEDKTKSIELVIDEGENITDLNVTDGESEINLRLNASELAELIASASRAMVKLIEIAGRQD